MDQWEDALFLELMKIPNELIGIKQVKKSYEEISKNVKIAIETNWKANIKIIHIEEKNIVLVEIVSKGDLYQ